MKILLLFIPGWETGQNLAAKLKTIYRDNFVDLTEEDYSGPYSSDTVLIRYGTSSNSSLDREIISRGGKVLNCAQAISNNCNKPGIFDILRRINMPTPRLWKNKRDIQKFPVLGRNTSHQAGQDVVIIKGNDNLRLVDFNRIPDKDYYLEFIPTDTEFRVYFYKDKLIKVFKKVFNGLAAVTNAPVERQEIIRNDSYGWHFNTIENPEYSLRTGLYPLLKEKLVTLAKEMNLQFGSFDLSVTRDGKVYVWEANSASWMGQQTLDSFVEVLKRDLESMNLSRPISRGFSLAGRRPFWN